MSNTTFPLVIDVRRATDHTNIALVVCEGLQSIVRSSFLSFFVIVVAVTKRSSDFHCTNVYDRRTEREYFDQNNKKHTRGVDGIYIYIFFFNLSIYSCCTSAVVG